MAAMAAAILAILAVAFIAYPLLRKGSPNRSAKAVEDGQLRELRARRDAISSAIEELELDFKSGTLAEEDYRDLEAGYRREALSLLKEIDALEKATDVSDEIERQVRQARQAKALSCPRCGARYLEEDKFCSRCGTAWSKGGGIEKACRLNIIDTYAGCICARFCRRS